MSIGGELRKLFEREPDAPTASDQSWPQESAGYYDDTSIENINQILGTGANPPQAWQSTMDANIPYRGQENHGVPFDASGYVIAPQAFSQSETLPVDKPIPVTDVKVYDPVPVHVVAYPEPVNLQHRIATSQFTVSNALFEPIRIAQRSEQRTRLRVKSANGTVLIGKSQALNIMGYLLDGASGDFEVETTDGLFAIGTSATVDTVYVIEEFATLPGESVIND